MIFALLALCLCDETPAEQPEPVSPRSIKSDADVLRVLAHVEVDRIYDNVKQTGDVAGALREVSEVLSSYRSQLKELAAKMPQQPVEEEKQNSPRVIRRRGRAQASQYNYFYDDY